MYRIGTSEIQNKAQSLWQSDADQILIRSTVFRVTCFCLLS